jgi:starch-binding outer membrane protein, SusD/RagB family
MTTFHTSMKRTLSRVAAATLVALTAACNADRLNIRDFNRPTIDGVAKDPNGVQILATGLQDTERDQWFGMISDFGIFGRESYRYFATDARSVSNYLIGIAGPKLDPGGFASGNWGGRFQQMRNVVKFNESVDAAPTLSASDKRAAKGFANTFYALNVMYLIISRDTLGTPVTITTDVTVPAPFVTRDSAYKFVIGTLDAAAQDLQAGGAAFPFALHSGFTGFNTPATFLRLNRALAARANNYRGSLGCGAPCYNAALTALQGTWAPALGSTVTQATLDVGVYHIFGTAAGDTPNTASFSQDAQNYAHASAVTDAQARTGGIDRRVERKVVALAAPVPAPGGFGIAATHRFDVYPTNTTSGPLVRAEELMMLRAEANIMTGNAAAALQDVNAVRTVSGGLPALASLGATQAAQLDAMLYEKRMSLLFEGHRWHDLRRYGRLGTLPLDRTNHFVARVMPIPQAECDGRATKPNGC